MTYRNLILLGVGSLMAFTAIVLPLAGLEQFVGDHRPLIGAMAAAAVSIGCGLGMWYPTALETYTKLASLTFFVLMLLGVLGLLSQMDSSAAGMQAGMPTAGWLSGR